MFIALCIETDIIIKIKMLLQKNEYHLTLEKEAPKILKICPAINRTYVYITACRQPAD